MDWYGIFIVDIEKMVRAPLFKHATALCHMTLYAAGATASTQGRTMAATSTCNEKSLLVSLFCFYESFRCGAQNTNLTTTKHIEPSGQTGKQKPHLKPVFPLRTLRSGFRAFTRIPYNKAASRSWQQGLWCGQYRKPYAGIFKIYFNHGFPAGTYPHVSSVWHAATLTQLP